MKFRSLTMTLGLICCVVLGALPSVASASDPGPYPDAKASDPAALGWMVGAPPPTDRIIRFDDGTYFKFPQWRWSVSNFRQLMPTTNVSRGTSNPSRLEYALRNDIDSIAFVPTGGAETMTWGQSLDKNYTDGIIILQRGRVVYERYFGVLKPEIQHGAMSVTKTFVGTLAALLVAEKALDPGRKVAEYVPELAQSAFGSATVRQLMDMTTGIRFSEDYANKDAEVWAHAAAGNPLPKPADYRGPRTYYEFLVSVQPEGKHGDGFHYRTANTDALGWVISRVTGRNVAQLLSEKIWRRLGAEQDAYMSVDSVGTPFAGGGLNASLRDLARFGEMVRNGGRYNGQQILPAEVVSDIRKGGNRDDFAKAGYKQLQGWSYRNMWWVTHNANGAIMARGVHGQALYIDPVAEMVIARFASHPVAGNAVIDPTSLPAYEAVARHLMRNAKR